MFIVGPSDSSLTERAKPMVFKRACRVYHFGYACAKRSRSMPRSVIVTVISQVAVLYHASRYDIVIG